MSPDDIENTNNDCNKLADDSTDNFTELFLREGTVDLSPRKDRGILKAIKRPGCSPTCPLFGDVVYLKYSMYLESGEVVDSREDERQPYSFTVGQAEVILAWEFGVPTMSEGEVSMFLSGPEYAFGVKGREPHVPPDATVIFKVELLRWHGKDVSDEGDGSIYLSLLENGETYGMPNDGAQCTVGIIGRYKGRTFEDRVVTFHLGEGSECGTVPGIEQALLRFSRNEKARIKVKSHVAYGSAGCEEFGIPPGADLEYDVHLLDCIRVKDFWDMTAEEKLDQSMSDKQKGICYFQKGNLRQAKKFFGKVIEYLQFQELSADLESQTKRGLLVTSHMNLALCHLKEGNPHEALQECSRALELDPTNEKCLYRRAVANMEMKDFKGAVEDLNHVIGLNPNNKIAGRQLTCARRRLEEAQATERRLYGRMFDGFATSGHSKSDV